MMDLLEECRPLYPAERNLRTLVSDAAQEHATQLACYWRQRGKVWTCTLGDDNTQFFHMSATVHWRRNQIRALQQDDGAILDSHEDKAALLHSFYCQLLGQSSQGPLPDDLQSLFATSSLSASSASALIAPFSMQELKSILSSTRRFTPLFFQANWHLVCDELLNLMHEFHQETADLMRINKAYLALLPKKANAVLPKDFRPISLQNGVTKICSKGMTIRLQPVITELVHSDQTGFIKGRCIAENILYAAEIVQCCHKRKAKAIALKLDFRKAFNSVEWVSLDRILAAKGFPAKWRQWVHLLNTSSQTAVVLNGVPGKWIQCRRGLRQGDPLSPYLFIIVADLLQQMIIQASNRLQL